MFRSHLVTAAESAGIFVPVPFAAPLEVPDGSTIPTLDVGSSHVLLLELELVAPLIGLVIRNGRLDDAQYERVFGEDSWSTPHGFERQAWLLMHECGVASVADRSALVQC